MILIFSEQRDPHVRAVTKRLRNSHAEFRIIDPFADLFLPPIELRPSYVPAFSAIWDRIKPVSLIGLSERDDYIIRERLGSARAIQNVHVGKARLMNHPCATEMARAKAAQLTLAVKAGLRVPRTYIGNKPREVLRFVDSCRDGAIAKSLTWFVGQDGRFSFTKRVDAKMLRRTPAAVAYSPLIYQEYIAKEYEVRVTCVGQRVFAARILSQRNDATKIDWRRDQFTIDYEIIDLPRSILKKLHFVRIQLGLVFAAFDLIVTPSSECVFLEVNATGNWMWIEKKLGLPISEAVAKWLARGHE